MAQDSKYPELTEKQRKFVEEYMIDLNGKQAAIRAGYTPQSAEQQASKMLLKGKVHACIQREIAIQSKRTGVTADRVIRELAKLAFINADDLINMDAATIKDESSMNNTAAIQSVRVKYYDGEVSEREVKLYDKIKAMELLGKHLAMFTDNLNVKGVTHIRVVHEEPADDEPDDD